jgi:[NiFe] hydrogenase diaphorase moiety small subunit
VARALTGRDDAGSALRPAGGAMTHAPDTPVVFTLDGEELPFAPGDTMLQAATRAGHYIPHLCWHEGYAPHGSCRTCAW